MMDALASVVAFQLLAVVTLADAHMSVLIPPSRNAVDKNLGPWANGTYAPGIGDGFGCNCVNGSTPCEVAQSCFWFSQGCTIGCKSCDGGSSNPNTRDRCGSGIKATINDPKYRTYNRNATAGSPEDIYQHNPWRAPGTAPVFDSCGMAGGGPQQQPGESKYVTTQYAKQGDYGSKVLPRAPTGIVWRAGTEVNATWSIRANHGGGYIYRLCTVCPADTPLTEDCFFEHVLPFVQKTYLKWGDGTEMRINATFVSEGTYPVGSIWAMNMLPYSNSASPVEFPPPCHETVDRQKNDTGRCSGRDPYDVAIVDTLAIPADIPPGEYVLGFRWDCEKSAQIWSGCSDVTIA